MFGVLNMLVSVASFLPIIVVGPISDVIGTTAVILAVAIGVLAAGVASVAPAARAVDRGRDRGPRVVDPIAGGARCRPPRWRCGRRGADRARCGCDRSSICRTSTGALGPVAPGPADPPDRD